MAQQGRKEFEIKSVEGLSERKEKGRGCYGAVFEVRVHGVPCIAKRLHDILVGRRGEEPVGREQRTEVIKKFREECDLLSGLRHPNVVQFLGVHYGQDEADISLIMEYMYMDLEHCITAYPNIPLPYKTSILRDVSYGLAYLHSKCVIHRDLNAGNVLLTVFLRAKIADLGVARLFDRKGALQQPKTVCPGARDFMPPESIDEMPKYDYKLDIFSVGHLILYLVNQSVPMVADRLMTRGDFEKQQVQVGKRRKAFDKMGGPSHPLYSTAVQCLSDSPDRRPTSVQLVEHMEEICKHSPVPHKNVLETHFELEQLKMGETVKEQMNKELEHMLGNSQAEVKTLVTTKKQLQTEKLTLSQEKVRLSQEKEQLMQDNAKLRQEKMKLFLEKAQLMQEKAQLMQEKAQLTMENGLKAKELLDYKKQANMYENERRRCQEVNTQSKSSMQSARSQAASTNVPTMNLIGANERESEERRRVEEERRRAEEERKRAEEEEKNRRQAEEERRRVEEEERRQAEEERKRVEEQKMERRKAEEEGRKVEEEEERRRAKEEKKRVEEKKRGVEEEDSKQASILQPTQPLQAASCTGKQIIQHRHVTGVPSEKVKQLQNELKRRSAIIMYDHESPFFTTQAAQTGKSSTLLCHAQQQQTNTELNAGSQLKVSNSMLQKGRDINASTPSETGKQLTAGADSELAKKLEIRRLQSESQSQDINRDKMGTPPHHSQRPLTTEVLKEKSDHVTLRQCEVKSYKNANEEEERRQFETSAATPISKAKMSLFVKNNLETSRPRRDRSASETISWPQATSPTDRPTLTADEPQIKLVSKNSDENMLSTQAELPRKAATLPRHILQQQISTGPSDDKGLADSPLKRPNRVSRGMRPWSIHVNETDELMKKLEKRKKLEQSHAQSQEMDNSTPLHLSQQPLTAKEKQLSVKHNVNKKS